MLTQDPGAMLENAARALRNADSATALQLLRLAEHCITVHMGHHGPVALPCIDCTGGVPWCEECEHYHDENSPHRREMRALATLHNRDELDSEYEAGLSNAEIVELEMREITRAADNDYPPRAWGSNPSLIDANWEARITKALG